MKDREEFLKKLSELVAMAKEKDNCITVDEVREYFSDSDLTGDQIELVFDYLLAQKVVVKGYLKVPVSEEKEEITYTDEEKAYLEEYTEELKAFKNEEPGERERMFQEVLQGVQEAANRLTELYLPEVVEIAKAMHHSDIFLGDMIQEGGIGLILGIRQIEDVAHAHDTIISQIKQSIQVMIEEYEEVQNRDRKMVEKVNMLDEAIKTLTEELGRKVSLDELAVYMGMEEDEVMDILRLMGEESEDEGALSEEE